MGASEFILKQRGKNIYDAYNTAIGEAEYEHGHEEGYSGAINSTNSLIDVTRAYKDSKMSLNKYIDWKLERASKRDCFGICIEEPKSNANKIKTQVEHIVNKGTTKWILEYVVYEGSIIGLIEDGQLKSFTTKGDAVSFARAHTEKTGRRTTVIMEKHVDKGSAVVARISYKKSTNEKDGIYCLFGLAPD